MQKYQGTETTLLNVQNDILKHQDKSNIIMLILFDLLAVFDTIDLFKAMQKRNDIKGN